MLGETEFSNSLADIQDFLRTLKVLMDHSHLAAIYQARRQRWCHSEKHHDQSNQQEMRK